MTVKTPDGCNMYYDDDDHYNSLWVFFNELKYDHHDDLLNFNVEYILNYILDCIFSTLVTC